jgi:hypothetical protein
MFPLCCVVKILPTSLTNFPEPGNSVVEKIDIFFRLCDGDNSEEEADQDKGQYRSFNYIFHDCLIYYPKESNTTHRSKWVHSSIDE